MGKPSRTEVLTAYVQHLIAVRRPNDGSKKASFRDIGKEFGVSDAHINNLEKGTTTVGPDFEEILANRLFRGDPTKLYDAALEWFQKSGHVVAKRERTALPNYDRADLLRLIAKTERLDERIVEQVLARAGSDGLANERVWDLVNQVRALERFLDGTDPRDPVTTPGGSQRSKLLAAEKKRRG